jgi:hypothetical protein
MSRAHSSLMQESPSLVALRWSLMRRQLPGDPGAAP